MKRLKRLLQKVNRFQKKWGKISLADPYLEKLIGGVTVRAIAIAIKEGKQ